MHLALLGFQYRLQVSYILRVLHSREGKCFECPQSSLPSKILFTPFETQTPNSRISYVLKGFDAEATDVWRVCQRSN